MIFEDMSHLKIEVALANRMRSIIENTKLVAATIEANLVDLDPVCKDYDNNVQALIDMPADQKSALIDATTKMNGKAGKAYLGLKWFDIIKNCCPDPLEFSPLAVDKQKISDAREELVKVRAKGRLVISTRTAATIIQKEKAGDVEIFLDDIKPLKVKLHKNILGKLNALKKKAS